MSRHDHGHGHGHDHHHKEGKEHKHKHYSHGHAYFVYGHGHHHAHAHGRRLHGADAAEHADLDAGRDGNRRALAIALVLTTAIMVLEFVGGLLTKSLALLSDSGHMLSDAGALALSMIAFWFASKPPSPGKTYGFYRFEILAALFNGVTLFVISGFIIWEAIHRMIAPPEVSSLTMIVIAAIGLATNLLMAWMLMRKGDVEHNLNLRGAYLHVLGDALGSIGAVLAGLVMLGFGWYIADPIISVVVALLILRGAWGLMSRTVHILMEGTPAELDHKEVQDELRAIPGVIEVHDLHVWTITSGLDSLSCHLVASDYADCQSILQQAIRRVEEKFGIQHTTIQIEQSGIEHSDLRV